jgi:hypothetical protein
MLPTMPSPAFCTGKIYPNGLGVVEYGLGAHLLDRWCQTNANQSLLAARCQNLCRTKLAPLGESGASVDLEIGA